MASIINNLRINLIFANKLRMFDNVLWGVIVVVIKDCSAIHYDYAENRAHKCYGNFSYSLASLNIFVEYSATASPQ